MTTFDFIVQKEFRLSLESDYAEMQQCLSGAAWKSVQVLAGSIVETLLVDYLVSTTVPGRASKDPLKMELADLIATCKGEKVLSARAADLCAVIRSYRNLIHPGRIVRLNESPATKDSATVASTLVHMIAQELGSARAEKLGMTAAQIVSKVVKDENSLSILKHLLNETNESQRSSMLLDLLPLAHKALDDEDDPWESSRDRISAAFSVTFANSEPKTQTAVAKEFVRMLKEDDQRVVEWFSEAFVTPHLFPLFDDVERGLVIDYLLGRIGRTHSEKTINILKGLGMYLNAEHAARYVDPFVRLLVSPSTKEALRQRALRAFSEAQGYTTSAFDVAVKKRLETWLDLYEKDADEEKERHKFVQTLIDYVDVPF